MKRIFLLVLAALIIMPLHVDAKKPAQPKYIFYMIGDGMGVNQVFGASFYNDATKLGPSTLNFTDFPVRTFVTTNSANSLVTDSAAGGTALATGTKTNNNAMGVDPSGNALVSVAELAKKAGYGAGVVTSVGVNHATPSAFYAHTASRSDYDKIAMQLIASDIDFAAGGGIITQAKVGKDAAWYVDHAKQAGIEVYCGKQEVVHMPKTSKRVICLGDDLAKTELKYTIDRSEGDTELADFTTAAVNYLYDNYKKGFFLMVEGGKIDYACHDNDAATTFQEVNDFAASIDVVLDFYAKHPDETLIIVTADHETGGLMLSSGTYAVRAERLAGQKVSKSQVTAKLSKLSEDGKVPSWDQVKDVLTETLGFWDTVPVSDKEEAKLRDHYESNFVRGEKNQEVNLYAVNTSLVAEAVLFLDAYADYSWPVSCHSGSPVGLYVIGAGMDSFVSCKDNTDIPKTIVKLAGYKK